MSVDLTRCLRVGRTLTSKGSSQSQEKKLSEGVDRAPASAFPSTVLLRGCLLRIHRILQASPRLSFTLLSVLLTLYLYCVIFFFAEKNANYSVKVSGVDISPYPISRGEQTTFNISASTGDEISAGKLIIDVNYFFFHVDHEEIDLCKETSCPVTTGDFVLSHHQTLPSITPPGSYTLTMHLKGDDGKQLTCITFGFSIGFIGDAVDFTLAELKSLGVK
ncbi:hypothetical protein ZIOFF_006862 [Zingiber officinale]|uniref:MD-2-related lipid-recognition domain-containing protein n=1 Tax=Zingiber officinale TaxID=94328 RepID=A0A8J5HQ91_ZINOF|nr:hypothetical protein ZIOFF_006862 [Zingiber officinale]